MGDFKPISSASPLKVTRGHKQNVQNMNEALVKNAYYSLRGHAMGLQDFQPLSSTLKLVLEAYLRFSRFI